MEFRILGPLEVVEGGRRLALGGPKQRALLAILLLHANEVVSTDRLIDELWGGRPPETVTKTLQSYVSQLRKVLGSEPAADVGMIATRAPGYALELAPGQLDLEQFERLSGEGREALEKGDQAHAAAKLREALALWRGPPLADLAYEGFAQKASSRLDEQRLSAVEDRIQADLALGRHGELVGELEHLAEEHPLRERPRGQLMLALYRSGRQAEALTVYRETRRALNEELGIEPSLALQELQRRILQQDTTLDAAVPGPALESRPADPAPQGPTGLARRRRAADLDAAVGVIGLAVAAVIAFALAGPDNPRTVRLAANAVAVVESGRPVRQTRLASAPGAMAAARTGIWVVDEGGGAVSRVDADAGDVRQTIAVGAGPSGVAIGQGAVWVSNGLDGTVSRIDPKANRVVQTIPVGNGPAALTYGFGAVWVANRLDQTVSRIDARTGHVVETLSTNSDGVAIAAGERAVWVADELSGRVIRLDPARREAQQSIGVGNGPSALVLAAGSLWVANTLDSTVSRIDTRQGRVIATVPVGQGPSSLAATGDGVWIGNAQDSTLSRIDPRTNRVNRMIELGQRPNGAAAAQDTVFVALGPAGASHRGGTLRLVAGGYPFGPLVPDNSGALPVFSLTNDGLTAFRRTGGLQGTRLLPDLATSIPTPSDGGRTYVFRLRAGIQYSTGATVAPRDVRWSLERTIELEPGGFYSRIVGASRCRVSHCDLSRGIVTDDAARTVTFHLATPDPDFLAKLALPSAYVFPAMATKPLPATGPFMVETYSPGKELKLVRNPRFHVWSRAARPDGYPDTITWKLGVLPGTRMRSVESGQADVAFEGVPPDQLDEIRAQYASQLNENPVPATTFIVLNTRVPPFDDARVRRAVSYGVDRAAVVGALGGADRARSTCQILPPNLPGYRPYCPFTLQPSPSGAWTAPDLARAQRLVAASGTRSHKVTVWVLPHHEADASLVVTLLEELGFKTLTKQLDASFFGKIGDSRLEAQVVLVTWLADYSRPSNFIDELLSCAAFRPNTPRNANLSEFCDPAIDEQIHQAQGLQATDPALAASLWSRIDREIVDRAPLVPLANPKQVDFVSRRVGNYQYSPQWGVLLDQLWVR